jgi:hypothetical protein
LKSLDINGSDGGEYGLPDQQLMQQLFRASFLTRLVINWPVFETVTAQQFADVIKQMTDLRQLVLRNVEFTTQQQQQQQPEEAWQELAAAAAMSGQQQLAAAISSLPQLQRLVLWYCGITAADLTGTGAAAAAAAAAEHGSEHKMWLDEEV